MEGWPPDTAREIRSPPAGLTDELESFQYEYCEVECVIPLPKDCMMMVCAPLLSPCTVARQTDHTRFSPGRILSAGVATRPMIGLMDQTPKPRTKDRAPNTPRVHLRRRISAVPRHGRWIHSWRRDRGCVAGLGQSAVGTYWTYRAMLRHPTIAYVFAQVARTRAGRTWLVDADEDAPEEAEQWVQDNIIGIERESSRTPVARLRSATRLTKVVWELVNGEYAVKEFVELLPDATQVLREDNGKGPFSGLQNGQAKLTTAECLYILNRSDAMVASPATIMGAHALRTSAIPPGLDGSTPARRLASLKIAYRVWCQWEVPKTAVDSAGKTMADYAREALPT